MKKFKSSIEISMENVQDVLNCPIVGSIRKETSSVYIEGCGTKPYFTKLVVDITGFDFPFTINCGSVLALDVCGTWYAFTKEEWDKHKNDEI